MCSKGKQRSLASEAVRYDQWRLTGARLNADPSLVVRLDFEDLSGADWTLRNAAEGNRSVPDATIVGCRRAEGRWREKQALDFQSVNDRVRLVVPGDFESMTLSAWVCVRGSLDEFELFSRALGDEEIQELYFHGTPDSWLRRPRFPWLSRDLGYSPGWSRQGPALAREQLRSARAERSR